MKIFCRSIGSRAQFNYLLSFLCSFFSLSSFWLLFTPSDDLALQSALLLTELAHNTTRYLILMRHCCLRGYWIFSLSLFSLSLSVSSFDFYFIVLLSRLSTRQPQNEVIIGDSSPARCWTWKALEWKSLSFFVVFFFPLACLFVIFINALIVCRLFLIISGIFNYQVFLNSFFLFFVCFEFHDEFPWTRLLVTEC